MYLAMVVALLIMGWQWARWLHQRLTLQQIEL
jgi:hypothetical protein